MATETTIEKVVAPNAENLVELMAVTLQQRISSPVNEDMVRKIVEETVAESVRKLEVTIKPLNAVNTIDNPHKELEMVLKLINSGARNVMLVGPSGTGKTTLAKHLAKTLDLPFSFVSMSEGISETHLFGRVLPNENGEGWSFRTTPFVETYRHGGVFLLDELDAAEANVMVSINAALENGHMCNPVTSEVIERHENCIIVTAANTYGLGADAMYVGRNQLCATSLERFVTDQLYVDYDEQLEKTIVQGVEGGEEVLAWVHGVRKAINQCRLHRIASTRLVIKTIQKLQAGFTLDEVKALYLQSWSKDEKEKVKNI